MTSSTTINARDGSGTPIQLAAQDNGSAVLTPFHLEDPTQRASLLAVLNAQPTASGLSAAQSAIVAAVQAAATATQPISASALPLPAGAATDSKLEAVRALLATALSTISLDSAGTPIQLAGVNVYSTTALTAASADGTTNASTAIGSVARVRGDFNLTVVCSSDFSGQYVVERKFTGAGGTAWHPLTALGQIVYLSSSASEIFSEPASGVDYRIRVTALTAGSITSHRFNQ